jgi:hypothetical protein
VTRIPFPEIWLADFEFRAEPGGRPAPVCLVAHEVRSGRTVRLWKDELWSRGAPPYATGPDSLFVAFYASAELGCHLALGWPLPARILDLYAEFKCSTAGLPLPHGAGLLGALAYHGLPAMDGLEKEAMRQLVLRGGPWTAGERSAILEYCQGDVDALGRLLPVMAPALDLPRALLRGRYMAAAARVEWAGVPIDAAALSRLRAGWDGVRGRLVAAVDAAYSVFDGHSFRAERWERWLAAHDIPWPRLASGALALDDDTFRMMARAYPDAVGPVRELRFTLGQLRLNDLAVGPDGRNRVLLSAFASKTGRNQPSNSKFIFGPSVWLRSLIQPPPGKALAYIDWSGQEYGIAAALSGDQAMMCDYAGGDPYLAFARRIGAVPPDATKATHAKEREQFKTCCGLGAMYGAGPGTLANTLGVPLYRAKDWLRRHRELYPDYWRWSDRVVDEAHLAGRLRTVFGWTLHLGPEVKPTTLRNFPMQANGAEMLRLACCLATERGLTVCCPVHDALLIEADLADIDAAVAAARDAMGEAARLVLDGFALRADAKVIRHPERYRDGRGKVMWERVLSLLPPAV